MSRILVEMCPTNFRGVLRPGPPPNLVSPISVPGYPGSRRSGQPGWDRDLKCRSGFEEATPDPFRGCPSGEPPVLATPLRGRPLAVGESFEKRTWGTKTTPPGGGRRYRGPKGVVTCIRLVPSERSGLKPMAQTASPRKNRTARTTAERQRGETRAEQPRDERAEQISF